MHFSWLLTKTSSKCSPKRQITAEKQNFLWHLVILVEVHTAELWCSNPIRYGFVAWAIAIHTRDFAAGACSRVPWVAEFFHARFPVSVKPQAREKKPLVPRVAPGARSGSKASPCVPTISWVHFILGSRISTPQNAPRYLNRLNVWEQAPVANWANLKTLPRVYWHVQNEPGACFWSKTPCALKVGQWNERALAKKCDAVEWDSA